jgi:catechol 2,3-dioxygenase-like lactoylglutathione lyase family enzyme
MTAGKGAKAAPAAAEAATGPIKTLGMDLVTLSVADLDRAVHFYTGLLGLRVLRRFGKPRQAILACGKSLLGLIEVKDYPGLLNIMKSRSHVSLLVSRLEFQRAVEVLHASRVRVILGPEPHGSGKRLWLLDPDDNKIALVYPKTKIG